MLTCVEVELPFLEHTRNTENETDARESFEKRVKYDRI